MNDDATIDKAKHTLLCFEVTGSSLGLSRQTCTENHSNQFEVLTLNRQRSKARIHPSKATLPLVPGQQVCCAGLRGQGWTPAGTPSGPDGAEDTCCKLVVASEGQ